MQLIVPAIDNTSAPDIISNAAVLREWIDQLPHIDQEALVERLAESLTQLNRHPHDLPQRAIMMVLYQEAFDESFEHFSNNCRARPIALNSRKNQSLQNKLILLNQELGFGYNRVLNDQIGKLNKDTLLTSIIQAMKCQERDILFAFERYRLTRPTSRQGLYQLYLLAEEHHLDKQIPKGDDASPATLFNRVQLLILSDPYSLPQQGIWALHDYLKRHARLTELKREKQANSLMIDIQGGALPRSLLENGDKLSDKERYRYLDTHLLCEATRRYATNTAKDGSQIPDTLKHLDRIQALQLLGRWHRNWNKPQNRQAERNERYNRIMMACGLTSIHHYLRHGSFQQSEVNQREQEEAGEEIILEGNDIFLPDETLEEHPVYEWRLFDLSESGAGLMEEDANSNCFQVGQLILMTPDNALNNSKAWMVGVVRRRLEEGMSKNQIGIQFVKGRLHPFQLKPLVTEASDPSGFTPAFLVSQDNTPSLLLTSAGLYKPNRGFTLRSTEGTRRVRAANLAESTRYFDLFSFDITH